MTRKYVWLPLIVAAALTATGLGVGFVGDDAYHLLVLMGERTPATDGNLFSFVSGDPSITRQFVAAGPYPWWTLPEAKAVFYRPLSTAMHRLDYALFGRHAVPWHLHAMLWYLAMVLGWTLIARKTLSAPVAAIAALLFAVHQSHWMPAVWLANRNALIACVPAFFGLLAHIRWREDGWKPGLPLSVLGYCVGMLGGEAWLGIAAYTAAYEMFGRRGPLQQRLIHVAPAAACAIGYAVAYILSGYGIYGSGAYAEPLSTFYFREAPGRMLALLGGYLIGSPIDAWILFPQCRMALVAAGAMALILFAWLLHWCWDALDERDRCALRWLIPGGIMSLAPVIAAFPMARLLLGVSIAGSAVVAVLLRHWWVTRKKGHVRAAGIACAFIAFVHVVFAPVAWPIQSAIVTWIGHWGERSYLKAPIDDARVAEQDIFLLATSNPMTQMYPPIVRRLDGRPMPRSWHCLSASGSEHTFARTGPNSFELEAKKGAMVQGLFADILRDPAFPFAVGDTVDLVNARIVVLDAIEGRPRKIRVECERPLEDPSLVFLQWKDYSLQLFALPPVGESREVRYFSAIQD